MQSVLRLGKNVLKVLIGGSGAVASGAAAAMALLVTFTVVSRYAFNRSFAWSDEYAAYLQVMVAMWALSYTFKVGAHIRVDTVFKRLPQSVAKWVEAGTYLFATAFVTSLGVLTGRMVVTSFQLGKRFSGVTETPLGAVQLIMLIGVGLLAITLMVETGGKVKSLLSKPKTLKRYQVESMASSKQE